jgi:uncharacterized protein (TIGR00369 family)
MNQISPDLAPAKGAEDFSALSGIEQLRIIFADPKNAPFGMGKTMGFDHVEIDDGRVVFGATPHEGVYNPIGTVHGGFAATLLDSCCGCAVHSKLKPGQGYTTLELKVAYHRPLTKTTGPIRAEGVVIQMGRRAAFCEGKLTDAQGRLYASATSTLLVFEQ